MNYIIWRLGPFTRQATSFAYLYRELNSTTQRARSSPSCNKAFNNQQMKNTAPNTAHTAHSQKWPKNSRNPRSPPASPPLHVRASRHLFWLGLGRCCHECRNSSSLGQFHDPSIRPPFRGSCRGFQHCSSTHASHVAWSWK